MTVEQISGLRKAAVLLVQMGKDQSVLVLRSLSESEVEALTTEIACLNDVDLETVDSVLDEFQELSIAQNYFVQGGMPFAEEVLIGALGSGKAKEVIARLSAGLVGMPFEFLGRVDPRLVLSFLQDEHPQTVTLVLAHMAAEQAAVVFSGLSVLIQADVAHRLAVMDRTSPQIVKQVEAHLERRLSSLLQSNDYAAVGGVKSLVALINHSDRSTERLILEGLEQRDQVLADEVRAHMFMFEDLVGLDDRSVQLLLRQVETKELATALKGVRPDVRAKIVKNMSERAVVALQDETEVLGPIRLKQVEEAQVQIVRQIRSLEESGEIVLSRGDNDDFVV